MPSLILILLFYLSMFLAFNTKTFILPSILIGVILFLKFQDIRETLYLTLILVLPFEKGIRGAEFNAVLSTPWSNQPGYTFYLGLSLKFVYGLTLFLLLSKDKLFGKFQFKLGKKENIFLFLFLFGAIISTFTAQDFHLAVFGLVELIFTVWLYFLAQIFLKREKVYRYFKQILGATLIFEGIIGFGQFLKGSVWGRYVESIARVIPFGWNTRGQSVFRSAGTFGHPTFYGSFISMLVPVILFFLLEAIILRNEKFLKYNNISMLSGFFLGIAGAFSTFSRSSWLSLAIVLVFSYLFLRSKCGLKKLVEKSWFLLLPLFLLGLGFSSFIFIRLSSVQGFFTVGTGRGRLMLIKEAWGMIKKNPLFGVGLNNFTPTMIHSSFTGRAEKFVYPVHNTLLLFVSEIGLLPTLFFFLFIIYILVDIYRKKLNWNTIGFWLACLAFLVNSQFHTLFSQDPSFEYFMLFLGVLSSDNINRNRY